MLRRIEGHFDVLISHHRGLEHQHTWTGRRLALVIIQAGSTELAAYEANLQKLIGAFSEVHPGKVIRLAA
ncbi:MAG: hypothetical protein ACR2HJ_09015 [Fimbriimonadales bacterium]